jgi:hypothetical protein
LTQFCRNRAWECCKDSAARARHMGRGRARGRWEKTRCITQYHARSMGASTSPVSGKEDNDGMQTHPFATNHMLQIATLLQHAGWFWRQTVSGARHLPPSGAQPYKAHAPLGRSFRIARPDPVAINIREWRSKFGGNTSSRSNCTTAHANWGGSAAAEVAAMHNSYIPGQSVAIQSHGLRPSLVPP